MSQWWNDDASPSSPEPVQSQPVQSQPARPQPSVQSQPSVLARSGANAVVVGAVSGIVAGLAGVGVGSALAESNDTAPGIIVGFVAATLGFLLNGWTDLSAGFVERGLRNGILGMIVALVGGFVGLAIADALFFGLSEGAGDVDAERIALVIGWLVIGTLVGVGIGALGGVQKASSGLLGGALGGGIGGLLFVALDGSREADGAMLVGALVAATTVGVSVGSVQRLRRRAWATVLDGPLAGREFILYDDISQIGSDGACAISLPGDPAILPVHFVLTIGPPLSGEVAFGASAAVDGRPFTSGSLDDGAVVQLGSTFLAVHNS